MNMKKLVLAGIVTFIAVFILDFIVHGWLLKGLYDKTEFIWRSKYEARKYMWLMTLTQFLFSFAMAWFYTKGYEPTKAGREQGIRFGLYVGIVLVAAQGFVWYVVLPVPFILNMGWLASTFIYCKTS